MNEQIQQALMELCTKLGTTVEHLLGVLVKQAYIDGISGIFTLMALGLPLIPLFRLVRSKTKERVIEKTEPWGTKTCLAQEWDTECGLGTFAWGIWGLWFLIFLVTAMFMLYEIPTCFINPEYHALMEIVNKA